MDWGKIKNVIYIFISSLQYSFDFTYISLEYKNKAEHYREVEAIVVAMKNDNITIKEVENNKENLGYLSAVIRKSRRT